MVIHGAVHIYMLRLVWYQQSFFSEKAEGQRELAQGHEARSVGARIAKVDLTDSEAWVPFTLPFCL